MSSDDDVSVKVEEEEEEVDYDDISNPDILTKYRLAADIANLSMKGVITQCVDGKDIAQICAFGDSLVNQQCAKSFKKKKNLEKGVAFPTCISVNDCICNFSPLAAESRVLATGDVVKIDLGCHIDGYIATVGHTLVVGGKAEGKVADCIVAAYTGLQVAMKMCRAGTKSTEFTEALTRVAKEFGVSGLVGAQSHQMQRFVFDGAKSLAMVSDPEVKVEECELEVGDVLQLDVCMTSGEGKMRLGEERTTVFKRVADVSYKLKMKASRYVLKEVSNKFATLPFTLRAFTDEKQARMGVLECTKHGLLEEYKVMYEKAGEGTAVGRFKATVVIGKNGTSMITSTALPEGVTSEKSAALSDETKAILARSSKTKKKRGKKKKKAAAAAAAAAEAAKE